MSTINNKLTEILASNNTSLLEYRPENKNKYHILLKRMRELIWLPDEIAYHQDESDVKTKLHKQECAMIKIVLGFFSFSDGVVADADSSIFEKNITDPYAKMCYRFAAMMEDVHAETYRDIIDAMFPQEADNIKNQVMNSPATKKKIEWIAKHMSSDKSLDEKLLAFICIEGIFFSSSFAVVFWFKARMLCPGLIQSNELIVRDENLHVILGQTVFNDEKSINKKDIYTEIIKDAVEIESEFARESCPEQIIDMNSGRLIGYIKYIADQIAENAEIPKIYNEVNTCLYMDNLGILNKTNFFEQASVAYKQLVLVREFKKMDDF